MKLKRTMIILINFAVGALSIGAWIFMAVFSNGDTALSSANFESLKYFTVLSNLFNGVISILYSFRILTNKEITLTGKLWKLTATTSVSLTFLTVMVFLGPLYGYPMMFRGANFWLHLICPVASILSFVLLERNIHIPLRYTPIAVIPTFVYSVIYVLNCIINGIGEWPNRNDFYGFLTWGNGVGAVIAVCIWGITWGISVLLSRISR